MLERDVENLELHYSGRDLGLDDLTLGMAEESLGNRSGGSKLAMGEVSFRLSDDREFHHGLEGDILDFHLVHHLDLVRAYLGTVDHLGIGDEVLQLCNLDI